MTQPNRLDALHAKDRGSRTMAVLGLMSLLACGIVIWKMAPESVVQTDPILRGRPITLLEGVHLLGGLAPSVAYVVETSDGLVLVDSGLESDCQSLMQQMKFLKLNPIRLKKILLTHAHGDHVLGAMYLHRLTGALVHAGRADSDILRAGGPPEALFSIYDMSGTQTHPTEVDVELVGGETIHCGDVQFQVIGTPGHTPGSLCFLIERDGQRILFTGDTIQSIRGGLGTYGTYFSPRYRSNAADYLATLKKLLELPTPDILLPGHPQVGEGPGSAQRAMATSLADSPGVNAEVTRDQWQSMLSNGIREMQRLVDRYSDDGMDFLDGTPRTILPGLYYLGEFNGYAVHVLNDNNRWYVFDAPGGAGLVEFLEQRLAGLDQSLDSVAAVLLTSSSPMSTGGLGRMIEKFKCPVIVRQDGMRQLRDRLPPDTRFVMASTLNGQSEIPITATSLNGRGPATVAYRFWRGNKAALVSGRLLVKIDNPRLTKELLDDLAASDGDPAAYRDSLDLLETLLPNVWLPAQATNGHNANLYDQQWQSIVGQNRGALNTDR